MALPIDAFHYYLEMCNRLMAIETLREIEVVSYPNIKTNRQKDIYNKYRHIAFPLHESDDRKPLTMEEVNKFLASQGVRQDGN